MNADAGIDPERPKGAAVHLAAMRGAFEALGAEVVAYDEPDAQRLAAGLADEHARARFDVVYERYALASGTASAFAQARGVPHVFEVNAPLWDEERRYRGATDEADARTRAGALFATSELVLAVSEPVATAVRASGDVTPRVLVRPNGVDRARFSPRVPVWRARMQPERLVVGFWGRLRPWHRFERLAAAFVRWREAGLDLHLVTVGEGDYAGACGAIPAERRTHVPWCTHEQVPEWVCGFDLLVLTYGADAPCYFSPLKLHEAMACEVVPVVPALGELPRFVGEGRAGVVYPADDEDSLDDAVAALVHAPRRRHALGRAAREATRAHTWDAIARDVLAHVRPEVTP